MTTNRPAERVATPQPLKSITERTECVKVSTSFAVQSRSDVSHPRPAYLCWPLRNGLKPFNHIPKRHTPHVDAPVLRSILVFDPVIA
jgi:hypothetical protein